MCKESGAGPRGTGVLGFSGDSAYREQGCACILVYVQHHVCAHIHAWVLARRTGGLRVRGTSPVCVEWVCKGVCSGTPRGQCARSTGAEPGVLCPRGGWLPDASWKVWAWEEPSCDFGLGNCFLLGSKTFEEGVWGCARGHPVPSPASHPPAPRHWKSRATGTQEGLTCGAVKGEAWDQHHSRFLTSVPTWPVLAPLICTRLSLVSLFPTPPNLPHPWHSWAPILSIWGTRGEGHAPGSCRSKETL